MGYVFDFNDAITYERWFHQSLHRDIIGCENNLMMELLQPMRGESILDIGCGTGTSFAPFLEHGLIVTGIDPSPYMLDIALKKNKNRDIN